MNKKQAHVTWFYKRRKYVLLEVGSRAKVETNFYCPQRQCHHPGCGRRRRHPGYFVGCDGPDSGVYAATTWVAATREENISVVIVIIRDLEPFCHRSINQYMYDKQVLGASNVSTYARVKQRTQTRARDARLLHPCACALT